MAFVGIMIPTDQRTAGWYRFLAAAVDDPAASQKLAATLQQSANDQNAVLASLGTDDVGEAKRFLQVADALLRGQAVQADMMQSQQKLAAAQMKMMQEQALSTHQTIERFKLGMQNALAEAESGYRVTKWMYIALFVLGISLVVTAVISGLFGRGGTWSTTLGVVGGAGTVATLLFGQQKALESSRADLMQLEIAVFSWLDNLVRLNTAIPMIVQSSGLTPALLQELWQQSHRATADVLELVQTYCEARPAASTRGRGRTGKETPSEK